MFEIKGKYTTAKVMIDKIDSTTINQIQNFVNDKSFQNPVAIMPDTHAGKGSVIGFTMPVDLDHVIPNTIGVDIGCGMLLFSLPGLFINQTTYKEIDEYIRKRVPMGTNVNKKPAISLECIYNDAKRRSQYLYVRENFPGIDNAFYPTYDDFLLSMKDKGINIDRAEKSIGTLGGGNHFIEMGKNTEGKYFCTIHCGSRQFGLQICNHHQNVAKRISKEFDEREYNAKIAEIIKTTKNKKEINKKIRNLKEDMKKNIPNKGFEYLYGRYSLEYLCDMLIAQIYAEYNRHAIAESIWGCYSRYDVETIETVHNYIGFHDRIIRKGAISAHKDEKVIIPFNSAYGSLVCVGKGNPEWNYSAPHGAGRLHARGKAKRELSVDKYKRDMEGIYSSVINKKTLDESPEAYKDPEIVSNSIEPTVDVRYRIKPIINIKV